MTKNDERGKPIVFWGSTGQAKVLTECVVYGGYHVVALFDNSREASSALAGVPLYYGMAGFEKWRLAWQIPGPIYYLVAIAGGRGKDRVEIHQKLQAQGLEPITTIHPTAFVAANAEIKAGGQILPHATICVEARLGPCCIVNTSASIDHECIVAEGVHVAPGAHLAGCVHVGRYAFIGTGATILPRVRIGEGAVVGAGAVVVDDVPPGAIVVGCPAKPLKKTPRS